MQPLFELGSIMATRRAQALGIDFTVFLRRHATGDWGDVGAETIARADDEAVRAACGSSSRRMTHPSGAL